MRSFRRDARGLSEIVGTLMLVLIVVGAAVAFSAFVQSYQKQLQAAEAVQHEHNLENLKVTLLRTLPATAPGVLATMNFTIISLSSENSNVSSITLNGYQVEYSEACYPGVCHLIAANNLTIPAGGQVNLRINVTTLPACTSGSAGWDKGCSGLSDPMAQIADTSPAVLNLYTIFNNAFTATFLPPVAVGVVTYIQTTNGLGQIVSVPFYDGASSTVTNDTILQWAWTTEYSPTTTPGTYTDCLPVGSMTATQFGEEVQAAFANGNCPSATGFPYFIFLNATDAAGLVGSMEFTESS